MANVRRGRAHLRQALEDIALVRNEDNADSPEFLRWHRNAVLAIRNAFHKSGRHEREFKRINYRAKLRLFGSRSTGDVFQEGLERAEAVLKSLIDEVDNYGPNSTGI